jgi:hypothetical protein
MLTGTRLFAGNTSSETIAAVMGSEPDWSRRPAELSPAIEVYLRCCLQKDPRQRVRDIGDMLSKAPLRLLVGSGTARVHKRPDDKRGDERCHGSPAQPPRAARSSRGTRCRYRSGTRRVCRARRDHRAQFRRRAEGWLSAGYGSWRKSGYRYRPVARSPRCRSGRSRG